jgi:L-cysteine:1D-myo-inositol 2-amino-2-deoxy-alpha-D-glucopyranoside ligase
LNKLHLYNSLSRKVELFEPLKKNEVLMYVCGITPDAPAHLGHAFTYITFDVLVRYLRFLGNYVRYVQNVTDIDDDILLRSKAEGEDWRKFGNHWTKVFLENMDDLGWTKPDRYVRATDSIPTIIKITSSLIDKGFAYEVGGTVYFEVKKFPKYGKLSRFGDEKMIRVSAERGANPEDANKKYPLDFVLWQKSKKEEPFWDSPWGRGRPGWHIECSSMIYDHLAERIDIHGGGEDLIFPHHESEVAQSESFTGKSPFAGFFLHTAYVRYKGEKMSKSLGNLIMVSDLLKKCSPNAIRWEILSHHYRTAWEFKDSDIDSCSESLKKLKNIDGSDSLEIDPDFLGALNDDLNTPLALEILVKKKPKSTRNCLSLLGFKV